MRPYEFWHPRVFEAPYYLYLLARCALRGVAPKQLAKANYALDHGELGLGSKFSTQMKFEQSMFLPTILLQPDAPDCRSEFASFANTHGYPLIVKPDIGAVGKGIRKLENTAEAEAALTGMTRPHLLQPYADLDFEYGVFFVRKDGTNRISGINQKHFPAVVGNGRDTIQALAEAHYRFTAHWDIFLKYIDTNRVPEEGETVKLSFIGSHTMGCRFTDDTHRATRKLEERLYAVCDSQPGFNFGRLDLKAESEEAFLDGDFVIIEVNGIASLPTHMFDPDNSLRRAYQIFLEHGRYLVEIAREHRDEQMELKSYGEIWQLAKSNHATLNEMHARAMQG